ncbi:MAG: hypothetical protein KKE00_02595, partial [Proteobacteria bacterium]|nr:hypothetical protein [Pseudomonadota bacterium]
SPLTSISKNKDSSVSPPDYNVCNELTKFRQVLNNFSMPSKIITASTREILIVDVHQYKSGQPGAAVKRM